jgi:aspartate/methionine/tyrosine aminotransferase
MTIIRSNLRELDRFFVEQSGWIEWVRPRGSTIGFPRLRSGIDADEFAASLVEAEGVLLLPGGVFGHHGNHVRIGFGRRDLPEGLPPLARFAANYAADLEPR